MKSTASINRKEFLDPSNSGCTSHAFCLLQKATLVECRMMYMQKMCVNDGVKEAVPFQNDFMENVLLLPCRTAQVL